MYDFSQTLRNLDRCHACFSQPVIFDWEDLEEKKKMYNELLASIPEDDLEAMIEAVISTIDGRNLYAVMRTVRELTKLTLVRITNINGKLQEELRESTKGLERF